MSYPVLPMSAAPARVVPFGRAVIELLLEYPDIVPLVLEDEDELSTIDGELSALSAAEPVWRDALQVEIVAVKAAEDLATDSRTWIGTLREQSRQLAQHRKGAAILQHVLVDPFPLPHEIRVVDLPAELEAMSRAAAPYAALLAKAGYSASDLASGAALAAQLRAAQSAAKQATIKRRAAAFTRETAQRAAVVRLRSLCGRLRINLPKEGKAKLKDLRKLWLPRQSVAASGPSPEEAPPPAAAAAAGAESDEEVKPS